MAEQMISSTAVTETPLLRITEDISGRRREIQNSISCRAFEIFEANGRLLGYDLEDWLQAESELLYPASLDISESDDALVVHGALSGFKAGDIEVRVEPLRLTIAGKRETQSGQPREELVSAQRSGAWIWRTIDLPVEVNTGRVTGSLMDGIIELTLPLAAPTACKVQSVAA